MNSNSLQIQLDRNQYVYFLLISSILFILGFTLLKASPDGLVSGGLELLVFWSIHIVSAMAIYYFCTTTYLNCLGHQENLMQHFFIGSLMGGLMFGVVAGFLELPFTREPFSWLNFIGYLPSEMLHAGSQSFIFWGLIHLAFVRFEKPSVLSVQVGDKQVSAADMVSQQNSNVYVVKSEGNYLKMFFANTTTMHLGVLKDFSKKHQVGCQIHRSYWVNSLYVERIVNINSRKFVFMQNGLQVPIGRTHIESGVIDKLLSKRKTNVELAKIIEPK